MRLIITEGSILKANVGMPWARQDHGPWRRNEEVQVLGRRDAVPQREAQSRGDNEQHCDK